MRIKVKVFQSSFSDVLENDVNSYLERVVPERVFVDIKYSTSAYYADGVKEELYSAMIVYKSS